MNESFIWLFNTRESLFDNELCFMGPVDSFKTVSSLSIIFSDSLAYFSAILISLE